jgi:hypothetical protein
MSETAVQREKCVHHWIIESPHGPTSQGRCRYCGAVAEFFNDLQGFSGNPDGNVTIAVKKSAIVRDRDSMMVDNS